MSGGHFGDCGYDYYKVSQFADELEVEIQDKKDEYGHSYNFSPEVIEYLLTNHYSIHYKEPWQRLIHTK
jgi:hypothetical protein